MVSIFSNNEPQSRWFDKRVLSNFLWRTETTFHDFVKPSRIKQNIGHNPSASCNKIIRKEGQR